MSPEDMASETVRQQRQQDRDAAKKDKTLPAKVGSRWWLSAHADDPCPVHALQETIIIFGQNKEGS